MIEIIKYKAVDGKVFDIKERCIKYEVIANQVITFCKSLALEGVISGDGYIQHVDGTKEKVKREMLRLANEWYTEQFDDFSYVLGRFIDDGNMKCLGRLMHIYTCMDGNERQWNQPYFANNPGRGVDRQVN